MSSYLPQKTFAVCTMQMSPTKGQLLADEGARKLSVIHSKKDAVLLTKVDLVLMNDFGCQNKWQGPAVKAGFFAGLVAGIAIAAAVAFSVCTFGVGAIIIGACAVAAAAYTYSAAKSNSTKCNSLLTAWQNPHPTVKFDQIEAVTQTSFITCGAGGMIQPFISQSAANSAAKRIAWANRGEVGLSGVISFMFGTAIGYAGASTGIGAFAGGSSMLGATGSGLLAVGKEALIGMGGAYLVYAPIAHGEKKGMRNWFKSDTGDTTYDRLIANQESIEQPDWFEFTYNSADDDYNPTALGKPAGETFDRSIELFRINQNDRYIERMMNVEGTKAEQRAAREAIAKEMSKTKSGAEAVREMRRKGSGEILPRTKTQTKGNRATSAHRSNARTARSQAIWGTKNKGYSNGMAFNGVALMLPLLVTPLDEYTIKAAADFAEEDIANGSSISSTTH
ncbi:protein of unknown function [Aquimarina amphilecti]|uniref:DUF4280 domain-containing protein n=1 Tax=Aquimarina amphilecti TaxID=1038014 RepID=A0A1H7Q7X2_AQUAM|nr:DUF4280 domain-containing protein [Aquimarina amphilecti]SEL43417.1 protein of unknown function [Aquimarina amphilecti]